MFQVIPLTSDPNQSLKVTLNIDDGLVSLGLFFRYNEIANYWTMAVSDSAGNLLVDSIPILCSDFPAANLLEQFAYLEIGSVYVINVSGTSASSPQSKDLGTDFPLVWGDTPSVTEEVAA